MDPELLRLAWLFRKECPFVSGQQAFPTKVRLLLRRGYFVDIFYRASTGSYSYALLKGSRRVIGWDNSPHYEDLSNFPHHFHTPEGEVLPSELTGKPEEDIQTVARKITEFLQTCEKE